MNLPTRAQHAASHDQNAACCLWCSDKVPWWVEARRRAGYERPPYEPRVMFKEPDEGFSTKEVGGPTVAPRQATEYRTNYEGISV